MPSTMSHLQAAKAYDDNASTLFYLGTVAPDVIDIREIKDKTHFRDIHERDRQAALVKFAMLNDLKDDFIKGIVFHLFCDYYWDIGPMTIFTKQYSGSNWFYDYRAEISIAGSWLFHNMPWAPSLWNEMCNYDIPFEQSVCCITRENLRAFLTRNRSWHTKTIFEPSNIFTPEILEEYSVSTAEKFIPWFDEILKRK